MHTESAISQAFDTVELLERTLTFLPCKDVLIAQRVSTFFKATIAGSPTLQKGLFLRAAAETVDNLGMHFTHKAPKPTLAEWRTIKTSLFGIGEYGDPTTTPESLRKTCGHPPERSVVMNPFIPCIYEPFRDQNGFTFVICPRAFRGTRKPQNWKKMFLSQPPINCVRMSQVPDDVNFWIHCGDAYHPHSRNNFVYSMPVKEHIVNRSGITLGELVTFMEDHYGDDEGYEDEEVFFYARLGTS